MVLSGCTWAYSVSVNVGVINIFKQTCVYKMGAKIYTNDEFNAMRLHILSFSLERARRRKESESFHAGRTILLKMSTPAKLKINADKISQNVTASFQQLNQQTPRERQENFRFSSNLLAASPSQSIVCLKF